MKKAANGRMIALVSSLMANRDGDGNGNGERTKNREDTQTASTEDDDDDEAAAAITGHNSQSAAAAADDCSLTEDGRADRAKCLTQRERERLKEDLELVFEPYATAEAAAANGSNTCPQFPIVRPRQSHHRTHIKSCWWCVFTNCPSLASFGCPLSN